MSSARENRLPNIWICIIMDLFGMLPYLMPWSSLVVAPVSAWIFFKLFGGRVGLFGAILDFLEELLPFTEIIPTYTIAWFIRKMTIR